RGEGEQRCCVPALVTARAVEAGLQQLPANGSSLLTLPGRAAARWGRWGPAAAHLASPRRSLAAEKVSSLGKDWHKFCLKCERCNKTLTPGGHAEHDGKPFCHKPCYATLFGPKGSCAIIRGRGGPDSAPRPAGSGIILQPQTIWRL
uniref:LIM zinc-binding domain-containing protein n=1 Tax=Dromaius novaehollandiae TaxID=8790 RepID=A0A8C4P1P6_DRONO